MDYKDILAECDSRAPPEAAKPKADKRKTTALKKKRFSNLIVFLAIIAVVGYTAAALILQFVIHIEVSQTLTLCWYGFWSCEIFAMTGIKIAKVKNPLYEQAGGNSYGGYYSGVATNDYNITETEGCGNG